MLRKIALASVLFSSICYAENKQMLDKVVAVINNGVITASELDAQVELSKKQILAQKVQMPDEAVLRKQVLQHLIDVNLQLQLAKQHNVVIDDADIDKAIDRICEMNHITVTVLREEIGKQGLKWQDYRENIRKEMTISRLQQKAVGHDIVIKNEQVEEFLKNSKSMTDPNATYRLQNIVIPLSEEPSSEEVKKAKQNAMNLLAKIRKGDDFTRLAIEESSGEVALEGGDLGDRHLAELPEVFAKEVVTMKIGQVVGPIRAGNGFQLIKLVAINGSDQHHMINQTHVRHILLKPDASMTPAESLKQVNNLYQQLKAGKDFATMAKQYSLDSGTAIKGGDLGWVGPGELVPEFEKVMNKIALHTVSKPIKSQFGWHIIEVLERRQKDDSEGFKKQEVRQFLHQRKFAEAVQNWQQHMRGEAYVSIIDKELA